MTLLPAPEHSLKYRPDVDGLRAVAVLSVVLYHLGLPLHGGYVGVDIFFTISGFLIGSIILRQTREGTFTFAGFYERRIRRIFPALFAMLLVCSLLAYRYLLPTELVDYAKSLAAAGFSASNFYFWRQSGYFDSPATSKPLLHTWSLAVEEQFYIFLPILLVLLRRLAPRRIELSIYLVAAASLALSTYGAFHDPTTTFYLAHTRAWELLCGTILALESCPRLRGQLARHIAGIVGILLIFASVWYYRTSTPFPGLAALPPCLGAALIIAAGRSGPNFVGRILSLKPIVFIGLISYSLYLWHWPVIVFHSFGLTIMRGLSNHQDEALLFGLSLVLATLSWRFVEMPFRAGALRGDRRMVFGGAVAALVLVAAVSETAVIANGAEWRFPVKAQKVAAYLDNDPYYHRDQSRNGTCFITSFAARLSDFPVRECLPDKQGEKKVLLLGDSHAAALWWGMNEVLQGVNVMQATASGCKPVLHQRPRQYASCIAVMDYVLKEYLPSHQVDAVLIAAHWDDGDLPSLGETLESLRQKKIPVILFGPIVQYDSPLPRLLALSISHNDPLLPQRHRLQAIEPLDREMAALARDTWHVPYVSLLDLFCSGNSCTEYAAPDVPLQSDYGHLNIAGSVLAAQRIAALGVLPHETASQ
jgi:peptidoglycan/LPS O-acetylase OafA/YrhL